MVDIVGGLSAYSNYGTEAVEVRPQRSMGPFRAQVVVEEAHTDDLEITQHPVETGARITDHAYMKPSELVLTLGWSNSPEGEGGGSPLSGIGGLVSSFSGGLIGGNVGGSADTSGNGLTQVRDVYQNLLELQKSRIPMSVMTGKRDYENMLIASMRTTTSKETENSMIVTVILKQILIVSTKVVAISAPADEQEAPESTQPTADEGTKQPEPTASVDKPAARESMDPVANSDPQPKPTETKGDWKNPEFAPLPKNEFTGTGVVPAGYSKDPQTGNIVDNATGKVNRDETLKYGGKQGIGDH